MARLYTRQSRRLYTIISSDRLRRAKAEQPVSPKSGSPRAPVAIPAPPPQRLHTDRDYGREDERHRLVRVADPYQHAGTPSEPESAAADPLAQPSTHDDFLSAIVRMPIAVSELAHEMHALMTLMTEEYTARPWSPLNTVSNLAGTNITLQPSGTAACWAAVAGWQAYTKDLGAEMRDMVIGTATPQVVQLIAIPGDTLSPTVPYRLLGTVRTTASALSVWYPAVVTLRNGETLALLALAGTVTFDFSGRWRTLRS